MAIDRVQRRLILERIGASIVIIFFSIAAWFLVRYENARSRDVQALSRIIEMQSSILSYAANHGIYPSMGEQSRNLGDPKTVCLSSEGFVSKNSDSCDKSDQSQVVQYTSLASDLITPCTDQNGCPSYKIEFI